MRIDTNQILRRARSRLPGLSLAAAMALACGGDGPTAAPQLGRLTVRVATTGADLDNDGYLLVVSPQQNVVVGPNATVHLDSISPGAHVLALEGVADNCTVANTQALSITVEPSVTASVNLSVVCDATGISVATHTTGSDQPLGFDVQVGASPEHVLANDSVLVTRVPPGSRTVALSPASNCSVVGNNPVTVDVVNRRVIPVHFDVTCAATEKNIAFTVDSVSGSVYTPWIFVADSNGAGVKVLAQGLGPAWSPDGTKLVFSNYECHPVGWDGDYACTGGLVVMDPETRTTTVLRNDSLGVEPAWSPDGNFMAFDRSEEGYTSLYVAGLDGSPPIRLDPPGVYAVRNPAWSPDSKSIAFQCTMSYGDLEICVINRDGTGFKRLTTNRDTDDSPAWSPDGSTIAFMTVPLDQEGTIALMTPSGTNVKLLTAGFDPAWSPNGSRLVFARSTGLFTIGSDGSNLKQITTGHHRAPTWRP
jgi:Tol biopolymer transport system component